MRKVKSATAVRAHRSAAVESRWEDWIASPTVAAGTRAALPSDAPSPEVLRHRIAELAYSYWEGRGYQGGSSEQDWLRAEAEILRSEPRP